MASRQTIIKEVKVLLKAGALPREFGVEEADYADLVNAALTRYSKDRPLVSFADYAGDSKTFDFPLPEEWDDSLSFIREVEYPQGERKPSFLRRSAWVIYAKGTPAARFRLMHFVPQMGHTLRLFYTIKHTADDERTSVPENDLAAVAWLAAAEGCHLLARRFAQSSNPTIAADSVDYQSKSGEYTRLGRELERKYQNHLGRKEGEVAGPAGASLDWDALLSMACGEYFTHGASKDR